MGGEYGDRRLRDFFKEHLLGIEPPDHNKPAATAATDEEDAASAGDS
jgi:hypothetical protein